MISSWGQISREIPAHLSPLKYFLSKLNKLQSLVLRWEKETKSKMEADINTLELDILILESHLLHDPCSENIQGKLKDCHSSRLRLLTHKEESL